jgi:phosphopantetheinyl transferase (holo-ACP synthase)
MGFDQPIEDAQEALSEAARELTSSMLEGRGCRRFGVRIARCPCATDDAGRREETSVEIEGRDGTPEEVPITHDERGAPYVRGEGPGGEARLLVSLSDEDGLLGVVWAEPDAGSEVVGVGIDIASTAEFARTDAGDHFTRLLFSDLERSLAMERHPEDIAMGRAWLLAAKEAAFKAASASVRTWYLHHEEEVYFEARDFLMARDGREVLSERRAGTYGRLGIGRIEVAHVPLGRHAVCCAVALRA